MAVSVRPVSGANTTDSDVHGTRNTTAATAVLLTDFNTSTSTQSTRRSVVTVKRFSTSPSGDFQAGDSADVLSTNSTTADPSGSRCS